MEGWGLMERIRKRGNMGSKWRVCTEDLDPEPLSKYRNYALIIRPVL